MTGELGIERLEDRVLLAASVRLKGTDLFIEGGAFIERVAIETSAPGTIHVDVDADGVVDFTFVGITNVTAKLGSNNDALFVGPLNIGGSLLVQGGAGHDDLVFDGPVSVAVAVDMGKGDDFISYHGSTFAGPVSLSLGAGNDEVQGTGAVFFGPLRIEGAGGNDTVVHGGTTGGNTYHGNVVVALGQGNDLHSEARGRFQGAASFDMGGGNDVLDFDRDNNDLALDANQFRGQVRLLGGGGFDILDESLQTSYLVAPAVKGFEDLTNDA